MCKYFWIFAAISLISWASAYLAPNEETDSSQSSVESNENQGAWEAVASDPEGFVDLLYFASPFRLYRGQRRFAISLLKMLSAGRRQSDVVSPHSIYRALLLAYLGAEGKTKRSLAKALCLEWADNRDEVRDAFSREKLGQAERFLGTNIEYNSVDKVYVTTKAKIKSRMLDVLQETIVQVDFETNPEQRRLEINEFIENATRHQIKDMLAPESISASTSLVLTNAAFFRGLWNTQFDQKQTQTKLFYSADPAYVEMMHLRGRFNYGLIKKAKVEYLEMPYLGEDGAISMFVFLPTIRAAAAVDDLLTNFTTEALDAALRGEIPRDVEVAFPKFSLNETYHLSQVLRKMGVDLLSANLGGFSKTNLHLDSVVHKAKIEVNEEGSRAAAATAIFGRAFFPPVHFNCDHPFVYLIFDKVANEVLFAGVFRGPNK